tara:strand:- start:457 stop:804 length:348 start_codon:yes stop_codon:yes gene_type:complete
MRAWLLITLALTSCGVMAANNGLTATGDEVVGFRTVKTEDQHEDNRLEAYAAGKADAEVPEPVEVDDGAIEIISPEDAKEIGGSLLGPVKPYAVIIFNISLLIASVCVTKRKKRE